MWNIEGLINSKLSDEHVLDIIAKFQIIGLVETWLDDSKMADGDQLGGQCRSSNMIYAGMHRQTFEKLT
jgi:hypothetical protein